MTTNPTVFLLIPCTVVSILACSAGAQASLPERPITDFVRRIHRDAQGDMWLGTNGDGVIRRSKGKSEFFTTTNGLGGNAVRGIEEDAYGNLWFGTSGGLTRYDGTSFTNYTSEDGLVGDDVWSLTIDSAGIIWVGTLRGVSRYDGERFTPFELPKSTPRPERGVTSDSIVHCIMEDSRGRMWFGNNDGAYIYNDEELINISERDGLCGNVVNSIVEDNQGRFWFATHFSGVCRMDGDQFVAFGEDQGIKGAEVWDLYKDREGNIWFPVEGDGVFRYDGEKFTNFNPARGLTSSAIQCTFEDADGSIWLGGWTGLFRSDGDSFVHITENEPW